VTIAVFTYFQMSKFIISTWLFAVFVQNLVRPSPVKHGAVADVQDMTCQN